MAERSVPLTAEQIYKLVKDWPAHAWPDGVRWKDAMPYLHRGFFVDSDGYHFRCHLAAALFRDSGLRWLMEWVRTKATTAWLCLQQVGDAHRIAMYYCADDEWTELGRGDSELAAISSAITRAKEGKE